MSLQDHVAKYSSSDSRKNARDALLDAITKAVGEVEEEGGGLTFTIPRLKTLAEAYALVVHGTSVKE